MQRLTDRQVEILEYILSSLRELGYPPTRKEICRRMGFKSPNAAESHLRALEQKGAITVWPGIARGIRVNASRVTALSS